MYGNSRPTQKRYELNWEEMTGNRRPTLPKTTSSAGDANGFIPLRESLRGSKRLIMSPDPFEQHKTNSSVEARTVGHILRIAKLTGYKYYGIDYN